MQSKSLPFLTALFSAILLISNIASVKIVQIGSFTFDGGTLLFPLSYIFSDIFTEVFGFRLARRTIWIGILVQLLAILLFAIVGLLPASEEWQHQQAYSTILLTTTRIVLASIIAFLFGSWSNDLLLSLMKRWSHGKYLWMRTIGSTIVGQVVDTTLFCVIAFGGTISSSLLLNIVLSNYVFKVGVEIFITPITYIVCNYLKQLEGIDVIDYHSDYTPFSIKIQDH
ncbi:MAG: queuosine precursor transporter [bacterium]|nr:queuosine precursor transporter [bacterium]